MWNTITTYLEPCDLNCINKAAEEFLSHMTGKMDLSLSLLTKLSQWWLMNINDVMALGKAV